MHRARTWTSSTGYTLECMHDGCGYSTEHLPPGEARRAFREHRLEMGEVVAAPHTMVTVSMPQELAARLDALRGSESRPAFLRRLIAER